MRSAHPVLLALLVCGSTFADDVTLGHRVALLVGNAEYDGARLPGVGRSLDAVERSLTDLGFRVDRFTNLTEKPLKEAVDRFARSVPTNGVAVVYYVGLGAHVERGDRTYDLLRPVDTAINNDGDYRSRAVNVVEVVETMRTASGARRTLWFLDACFSSPIKPETDAVRPGLRAFDLPAGTTVIFAAGSEKTLELPTKDEPTQLAASLARHAATLEESIAGTTAAIAKEAGGWVGGASDEGIGPRSDLPVADAVRDGRSPGEGFANSVGMSFRWCPPGSFTMGSDRTDTSATRDREPVKVTLSRGFWMGECEVTQREYGLVMRKNVPLGFTTHPNVPYWGATEPKSVTDFCAKLNDIEKKAGTLPNGWEYDIPTEAEWEYACRAGSTTAYCFGDSPADLGRYGNFADNALWTENPDHHWAERRADDGIGEALAIVGSYRPNAWGLRDMHGNVAEIVADHLTPELPGGTDPLARLEKEGVTQVRGGAWCSRADYCESSFRNGLPSRDKLNYIGYRILLRRTK